MSNYVRKASWSYYDYLQAKSFEDSIEETITYNISDQTKALIASNNEIHEEQKLIAENLRTSISEGLSSISLDLQELNATFHWGFSEVLSTLRDVNASLSELIQIAKTPAQTWAYEQFEIARDAYRKGLYRETLEYLDHAINGHESNVGYKLEFRFHYLKGLVHLGSYKNSDPAVVDLSKATTSFLQAARYSQSDYPLPASQAYLAAGWASYCLGKMENSLEFTEKAVELNKNLSEGYFQSAKILMHTDQPNLAIPWLEQAIEKDRRYATKASSDGDFQKYEQDAQKLINTMRHSAYQSASKYLEQIKEDFSNFQNISIDSYDFHNYINRPYEDMLLGIRKLIRQSEGLLKENTLYSCLDAQSFLSDSKNDFIYFRNRCIRNAEYDMGNYNKELQDIKGDKRTLARELENTPLFSGWLIGGSIFYFSWIVTGITIMMTEATDTSDFFIYVMYTIIPGFALYYLGFKNKINTRDKITEKIHNKNRELEKTNIEIDLCEQIIEAESLLDIKTKFFNR